MNVNGFRKNLIDIFDKDDALLWRCHTLPILSWESFESLSKRNEILSKFNLDRYVPVLMTEIFGYQAADLFQEWSSRHGFQKVEDKYVAISESSLCREWCENILQMLKEGTLHFNRNLNREQVLSAEGTEVQVMVQRETKLLEAFQQISDSMHTQMDEALIECLEDICKYGYKTDIRNEKLNCPNNYKSLWEDCSHTIHESGIQWIKFLLTESLVIAHDDSYYASSMQRLEKIIESLLQKPFTRERMFALREKFLQREKDYYKQLKKVS